MRTTAKNLFEKFYSNVPFDKRKQFKTQLLTRIMSKYTNNLVISESEFKINKKKECKF